MAWHGLCLNSSHHTLFFIQSHKSICPPPKAGCLRSKPSLHSSSPGITQPFGIIDCAISNYGLLNPISLSKRTLNLSILSLILSASVLNLTKVEAEEFELERYTDSKEGFTLLRPSSWVKVDKAGATVLFEEANQGTDNVGVVVSPVRVKTLADFGTPQVLADKLIEAEKRKESTKEAEVISVSERSGQGGIQVYEVEYRVNSTRGGMKQIFSAAFVASKKLYILNIANSEKPEDSTNAHRKMILEYVLHSFDAAPSS